MSDSDWMKCRWCSYRVKKHTVRRTGERISGWTKMRHHAEIRHPEEYAGLRAEINTLSCDHERGGH